MKRILMATDLSARSDRALERALRLAADRGGDLTVVHVIDEGLPARLADAQEQAAKQAIQEHIATLTAAEGLRVSVEVVFDRAYLGILEMTEKMDAEMIVLGLHREDTFRDMFRGTTAERVVRAGDVPVLLVKERPSGAYRRIMVGVDFSVYSRRAVEFAVSFAPSARFHLVHAYDVPFKGFLHGQDTQRAVSKQHETQFESMVEEEMAAFLSTLDTKAPEIERIMEHGVVREVILRQVEELKPDLLVVGTHGRTGVAHALLGSVAESLLRDPPCDVLAVNAW